MLNSGIVEAKQSLPRIKWRAYLTLVKDLQTGLLVLTGLAGYMSGRPTTTWGDVLALLGSLFLAISGSTVLNMVADRDIDALMSRTCRRPLPSGTIGVAEGVILGLLMAVSGTVWALRISVLYGAIVFTGLFLDVFVYTLWLKRRTAWSIIWGGVAGGMPLLAGRALALGRIDNVGVWLAFAVLLWIPTHMMTFGIKYADDYREAGVPIFPNRYGVTVTRAVIGLSTGAAVVMMLWAMYLLHLNPVLMWSARVLGCLLFGFTVTAIVLPKPKLNFLLYKSASVYMLGSMLILIFGA